MKRPTLMRFIPVTPAALALVGVSLSSAIAAESGDGLFAAQCADCHGGRDIARWSAERPDEGERRDWLDGLLQRHFPPRDDERALIIEYIETVIAEH